MSLICCVLVDLHKKSQQVTPTYSSFPSCADILRVAACPCQRSHQAALVLGVAFPAPTGGAGHGHVCFDASHATS